MPIGFQNKIESKSQQKNKSAKINNARKENKDANEVKCADHICIYFKQRQQVLKRKENVNPKIKVLFLTSERTERWKLS